MNIFFGLDTNLKFALNVIATPNYICIEIFLLIDINKTKLYNLYDIYKNKNIFSIFYRL